MHISVFAKKVDKERSAVVFESEKVSLARKSSATAGSSPPDAQDRQTDDARAAFLIDVLTDPYRFISAWWQTVQTFPRLV